MGRAELLVMPAQCYYSAIAVLVALVVAVSVDKLFSRTPWKTLCLGTALCTGGRVFLTINPNGAKK